MRTTPLKVLLVHCFYRTEAPSGEDAVYYNERQLLEDNGIELLPYEIHNDDIDDSTLSKKIILGINTIWSQSTYKEIDNLIREKKPDIAHFHNTFPQISPSAYAACKKHGIPVIQTLHNFRLICPGALLLRNGKPCEDCLGTNLLPALKHRCYRGSLTATGVLAATISINRVKGSYRDNVDYYIALSKFAVSRFVKGGLPENKLIVKPNFLPGSPELGTGHGGYAVYAGRLSEEKGVINLVTAWKQIKNTKLLILGDGPEKIKLEKYVAQHSLNVEFLGFQPREVVIDKVANAMFCILPSLWYEGFPMAILEAMSCGTPVLASAIGSMAELIIDGENGYTFDPTNLDDIAEKCLHMISIYEEKSNYIKLRNQCKKHYDANYDAENNFKKLLHIYNLALSKNDK